MMSKNIIFVSLILTAVFTSSLQSTEPGTPHYYKIHQDEDFTCTILSDESIPKYKGFRGISDDSKNAHLQIRISPAVHTPSDCKSKSNDNSKIIQIFANSKKIGQIHLDSICKSITEIVPLNILPKNLEIFKIIENGNQSNRIDVTFMGDGYQLNAKEQFLEDIRRLASDMFTGPTFKSYLPLFNIWAIFVESVDSGIGYDGGPKNTPFKLYREGGQLRAIWPGDTNYARQVCQLTGVSGCDYPSLIGNDDFYGGLGGEFVVSTKSRETGTVVLRHEMGHNFADVGDEYDNSWAYNGANNARTLAQVGWRAWLTDQSNLREERAIYRLLEYPWADLSKGSQSFQFLSDGSYSRWYLLLSVSAAGENDSLEFTLDGEILPWTTRGSDDREFYDWSGDVGLSPGVHTFTVRSKTPSTHPEIPRMICSVTLHELGNEDEYHSDNNYISAYPTWGDPSIGRVKTLRPTSDGCLMRNMSHPLFCSVCKESMWLQFLERISLIDSLDVSPITNPDGTRNVTLSTLRLGQLREPGNEIEGERLDVSWLKGGVEQVEFKGLFNIAATSGGWSVVVQLITPEVRTDPNELLKETQNFQIL